MPDCIGELVGLEEDNTPIVAFVGVFRGWLDGFAGVSCRCVDAKLALDSTVSGLRRFRRSPFPEPPMGL
jgi:hypothetical protein